MSCAKTQVAPPDLGGIYTQAAMRSHEVGNPVIVIPGILGSKLRDSETGQLVWGAFDGGEADPARGRWDEPHQRDGAHRICSI